MTPTAAQHLSAMKRRSVNARWAKATPEQRAKQGMNFHAGLTAEQLSQRNRAIALAAWKKRKAA